MRHLPDFDGRKGGVFLWQWKHLEDNLGKEVMAKGKISGSTGNSM